jgi:quercetin dioxygenase-like cupin family protein
VVYVVIDLPPGAIEPAHHHTHGHDVFVLRGSKRVENITLGQSFELSAGDYLYTQVTSTPGLGVE